MRVWGGIGVFACFLAVIGCHEAQPEFTPVASIEPPAEAAVPDYRFGVRPMRTTRQLWRRYSALLDELNRGIRDFRVRLASAQTESTYEDKLKRKQFEIAIVEPHRVLEVEDLGYRVFARAGNEDQVGALIVVRRDSAIRRLRDLKRQTISFPSRSALAPTMMVRLHLARAGLNPNRDARCEYTGSQESALLNVYLRKSSAAAVSKSNWKFFVVQQPAMAAELDARWATSDLPGSAFMASERVPLDHLKQFQTAFAGLRDKPEGRAALTHAGFTDVRHGESGSYDALWEFMSDYRRHFGRLPGLGAP